MEERVDYNEILGRYRQGDATARERLFAELQVRLRPILKYRLWGWSAEDLDDILQETLMVVADKLDHIDSNPDLFALDVLRKKIGNRLALRQRRSEISLDSSGGGEEDDAIKAAASSAALQNRNESVALLESEDLAAAIRRAIRRLSPLCQLLFAALLDNLSVAETWEQMRSVQGNLRRSTFDKRVFDCRKRLRLLLADRL